MKILITGGSGFIGTNLVSHYLGLNQNVLNIDINYPRNAEHAQFWMRVDITDSVALAQAVCDFDPDYCFHLAARTDLKGRSVEDYAANTVGVANIIEALKHCKNLKLVVFASSMLVCKIGYVPAHAQDYCPSTPYGLSKALGEQAVLEYAANSIPWVIVRPTSIWGPWFSSPYRDFFTAIQRGFYFHPGQLRIKRSYGFVLNTIYQLSQVQKNNGGGLVGRVTYLADYDPIELFTWAQLIASCLNSRPIRSLPLFIFKAAALIGDILISLRFDKFPMSSFRLNNMRTEAVFDLFELSQISGRLPYTTKEGVIITSGWLENH